jgi:hypothetical protein
MSSSDEKTRDSQCGADGEKVLHDGIQVAKTTPGGDMRHLLLASITVVLMAGPAAAQMKPDLSGTWEMDLERSVSAKGSHNPDDQKITRETLVIRQTEHEVVIERQRGSNRDVITYPFANQADLSTPPAAAVGTTGTEPRDAVGTTLTREVGTNLGTKVEQSHAEVQDGNVLIKTVLQVNGKSVTTDEFLSLAAGGRELVVVRQLQVHHGYEHAKGHATAQDVYIRKER